MTAQQQDAYVVETLGIDGWKPGQMCQECNDAKAYAQQFRGTIGIHTEHEIPPPSIRTLEGMGKLLVALRKHRDALIRGTLTDGYPAVTRSIELGLALSRWIDGDGDAASLADAAFAALQGDTHAQAR